MCMRRKTLSIALALVSSLAYCEGVSKSCVSSNEARSLKRCDNVDVIRKGSFEQDLGTEKVLPVRDGNEEQMLTSHADNNFDLCQSGKFFLGTIPLFF